MLVDTHCHLHRAEFDADRKEVVRRAEDGGVTLLLDPATDFASNQIVAELTGQFPQLYAAVGVHPHHAAELTSEGLQEISRLAQNPKVVAIGEIGLDYYRNFCPPEVQQLTLKKLLHLSRELGKPMILHCRDAYTDLFLLLKEALSAPLTGVLHCFSGTEEQAQQALEMGLYLSFAGNLTYPKSDGLRAVAKIVPPDRVLLETDAPFLSPQAFRGKRNEPANLTELARLWAELRGTDLKEVAETTTANARELFGLE